MDSSKKGLKKAVKLYFVIPENCRNEEDTNDCMKMAFQECVEADLTPKWLTVADCAQTTGTKNTVFVLQEFAGDIFQKLRSTKSVRVCGPMCLRSCVSEGLPIPENKGPVFTTAMRSLIITASQVSPNVKASIKEKVGFMGGVYVNNLVESVTHLVTDAVRSAKYEIAGERGIPAMTVGWVEAAWTESQTRNIKASDPELVRRYKCPIFLNMFITSSNLSKKEKEEIKKLVSENGGTFTAQLRQMETTLLVIREPRGEKYKHARSWDLPCVLPSYVMESVQRGYAVPSRGHLIEPTVSSSTPTKDEALPNFSYNSEGMISAINLETSKTHIDETLMSQLGCTLPQPTPKSSGNQHEGILNILNVSDAKKAGSFVDGCKVFLSGFSAVEVEKLRRILSLGGATVFSELSDSVSHALIGEFIVQDMKALLALTQRPHVVNLGWLAASIKQKSPSSEEPFNCLETKKLMPEPPSPLSQKGMQLLQPSTSESAKMPPPAEPPINRKLFSEFLKENAKSPAKLPKSSFSNNSTTSSQVSSCPEIFTGQKFLVTGFEADVTADIEAAVTAAGGIIMAAHSSAVADYAVVPLQAPDAHITAVEVVTNLWLEECIDRGEVVSIQYYHQPFSVASGKEPLTDCCLSLSNYFFKEKAFLIELAELLGATYQDVFARVAKENKGVMRSTHLVCPHAEGQKYNASVKWGLPAVTKDWLLACARLGIKMVETPYLVSELKDLTSGLEQKTAQEEETPKTPTTPMTPAPSARHHLTVTSLKRKSCPQTPDDQSPFHVSTPDTPYGQVFETPTAETKKRWKKFIDSFPSKPPSSPPHRAPRRVSTPLSELTRKVWAACMETMEASETNINPNYSIEEMDEDKDENAEGRDVQTHMELDEENKDDNTDDNRGALTHLRMVGKTPKSTSVRTLRSSRDQASQSSSKGCENIEPHRMSVGRATPTPSDFQSSHTTPASQSKLQMSAETPRRPKQSPTSERACAMLDQLHQRLSLPKEPQLLPKRDLISPTDVTPTSSSSSSSQKQVPTTILPESQPILIGWEDPVESAERAKLLNTSSSSTPVETKPQHHLTKPRRFVLSNVQEREKYEELLKRLGETVISVPAYNSKTTHLIADKPLRSEKLLCCLAAGKWVLHTSYIDKMVAHNQYLPEEENYEWGNPDCAGKLPSLVPGSIEYQLACAAARWRKQLSNSTNGAFTNMKAHLIASPSKYDSYKRLIIAGGGEIVSATSILQATHCFVESSLVGSIPVPLSELVANGVPCLAPVFLGDMLTKFPAPTIQDGLISDYRKLLQQTANKH